MTWSSREKHASGWTRSEVDHTETAVVYVAWGALLCRMVCDDLKSMWGKDTSYVVWGLNCSQLLAKMNCGRSSKSEYGVAAAALCDCSATPSQEHTRVLDKCRPRPASLIPGQVYASTYSFESTRLHAYTRPLADYNLLALRFYTFEPLLGLGITRALYMDSDVTPYDRGALEFLLQPTDRPVTAVARCNYAFADALNFSHPLVTAGDKSHTVNTGVLAFPSLVTWCSAWKRILEVAALRLTLSQTHDAFRPLLQNRSLNDQEMLNGVMLPWTHRVAGTYNFRPDSRDALPCHGDCMVHLRHQHTKPNGQSAFGFSSGSPLVQCQTTAVSIHELANGSQLHNSTYCHQLLNACLHRQSRGLQPNSNMVSRVTQHHMTRDTTHIKDI